MPDPEAVRAAIIVPEPKWDVPFVGRMLKDIAHAVSQLDPWSVTLPPEPTQEPAP